jgi:hypothetical protein
MTFFSWPDRITDFLLVVVEQKVFSMGEVELGRTKKHWSRQKAQWEGEGGILIILTSILSISMDRERALRRGLLVSIDNINNEDDAKTQKRTWPHHYFFSFRWRNASIKQPGPVFFLTP